MPDDRKTSLARPIVAGSGASDYERYLRTDELLALQKRPEEMAHRDELLFQTVHQSSELWLKHACFEIEGAIELVRQRDPSGAVRLLRRAILGVRLITAHLEMLEQMSPWDYQRVRKVLGKGSGFDSPGFNQVRRISPELGRAFDELLAERGLTLVTLYRAAHLHRDVHELAERLVDWDERLMLWRAHHLKTIERVLGTDAIGCQGTSLHTLQSLSEERLYPKLWEVRGQLTALAGRVDGDGDGD